MAGLDLEDNLISLHVTNTKTCTLVLIAYYPRHFTKNSEVLHVFHSYNPHFTFRNVELKLSLPNESSLVRYRESALSLAHRVS